MRNKLIRDIITRIVLATALLLTSCAGTDSDNTIRPAISLAVLVAIEEYDEISADGVLGAISDIRDTVNLDGEVTVAEIMAAINLAVETASLPPSRQFALTEVIALANRALTAHGDDLSAISSTADKLLTWAETAARMAQ